MTSTTLAGLQQEAVAQACARIAPTWPLDQMIAVNPWWEMRDRPFAQVSAELAALGKIRCLMPSEYFRARWQNPIQARHLVQAAELLHVDTNVEDLLEHLLIPAWQHHWLNFSDLLDQHQERPHKFAWQEEITQQISQFCASFFQLGGPYNTQSNADHGLYRDWLDNTRQDRGLEILMAEPGLRRQFTALPEDRDTLFAEAFAALMCTPEQLADYLHALLLDINGWASWIAYGRWQTRLQNGEDKGLLEELLAMRLAWDLVLWRHCASKSNADHRWFAAQWQSQWARLPRMVESHAKGQRLTWVWQRAAELAYQESLHHQLVALPTQRPTQSPVLQAVFCIDVRSEPLRRALEAQHADIQTLGFAGFFGLPLEYQPAGLQWQRPQLPGLLSPSICVTEAVDTSTHAGTKGHKAQMALNARWQTATSHSPATFSFVEAAGLAYGFKLLKESFFPKAQAPVVQPQFPRAKWVLSRNSKAFTVAESADLVGGILKAMGLTQHFASVVLLVGHGSLTRNNPHAASLDCGACGGQTGEVNVRVLAQLLNDPAVRQALCTQQIEIPDSTHFQAALHNTTTEDIACLGDDVNPAISAWLSAASALVRRERASKTALRVVEGQASVKKRFEWRTRDWSQTRPEWGLANNASFIVGPRSLTRGLNLQGRSFLHDYEWQEDPHFKTLELIMTAPMVVTHWINMQYNASSTDNVKYGSGNKVLHNVVGGNLGVFEGNGGDLRIGLSLQSLHDGHRWMHETLRLSVYLVAPRQAIADIVARHTMLANLIDNDWLHLFAWDPETRSIAQYYRAQWRELSEVAPHGTHLTHNNEQTNPLINTEREYA